MWGRLPRGPRHYGLRPAADNILPPFVKQQQSNPESGGDEPVFDWDRGGVDDFLKPGDVTEDKHDNNRKYHRGE